MTDFTSKWLVETGWLRDRLSSPGLVIIDATWTMPGEPRKADELYREAHIPGAIFFDIDEIADTSSPYPHMLPAPEKFASRMRKMGVGDGMKVVVYDHKGLFSAPRVWWNFRVMGHEDVVVLNGGLAKWRAEDRPLEAGAPAPRQERHFTARRNAELVRDMDDVKAAIETNSQQILDARPKARFDGQQARAAPGAADGAYARRAQRALWIARKTGWHAQAGWRAARHFRGGGRPSGQACDCELRLRRHGLRAGLGAGGARQ